MIAAHSYATRTLLNVYLADGRRMRFGELVMSELPDRVVDAPAPELRLLVLDALATLPPKARAVVVPRYCEDMSVEQVAGILGCSRPTPPARPSGSAEHRPASRSPERQDRLRRQPLGSVVPLDTAANVPDSHRGPEKRRRPS